MNPVKREFKEVRRYMLQWLSDELTDSERDYFCSRFVTSTIKSKSDLRERKAFANRLMEANSRDSRIKPEVLKARLAKHLRLALYQTSVENYFANGYSIPHYICYLRSGLALRTGTKYESKFLAKSLLGRKA